MMAIIKPIPVRIMDSVLRSIDIRKKIVFLRIRVGIVSV